MINDELLKLNIEFLKMNLEGSAKTASIKTNKKGYKLEDCFKYYITRPENGGNCLEDLEKNSSLFNYTKEKRKFDVDMIGFVQIKNIYNSGTVSKNINLFQYKCYEPEKEQINLNYMGTNIEYNSKDMVFKQNKMISQDIIDCCHNLTRIYSNKTTSSDKNFFQKVKFLIEKEKISLKDKYKVNITPEELTNYFDNGKAFLEKIKTELNSAQKGYPTIKKFVKLNIETDSEKDKKDIYIFHITFRRELDAAFRVKQNYDFIKFSGFEETHLYESEENIIFKENDILLFELKDTTFSNTVATYINNNYYILNSHIELLKEKDNFKNCRFFYVGVQEQKKIQNVSNNNEVYKNIREKEEKSSLKVKLFEFINDNIFHVDLKLVEPEKIKILNVLKDEFDEIQSYKIKIVDIENKIATVENKIIGMENKIVAVENRIVGVENRIVGMENKIVDVENKIVTVENKMVTVENKISTLETKIGTVENRIATVENQNYALKNKLIVVGNDIRELKNTNYIMLAVIICLVSFLIMINFKNL